MLYERPKAVKLTRSGLAGMEPGRGFYIFTIIKIDAHPIITLRMALTTLPDERSLSSSFTTFVHVASHASPTRWCPVSRRR